MKKKAFLTLLALASAITLAACGNSSSGKKCNGDTCKIGYRYQMEKKALDIVIR